MTCGGFDGLMVRGWVNQSRIPRLVYECPQYRRCRNPCAFLTFFLVALHDLHRSGDGNRCLWGFEGDLLGGITEGVQQERVYPIVSEKNDARSQRLRAFQAAAREWGAVVVKVKCRSHLDAHDTAALLTVALPEILPDAVFGLERVADAQVTSLEEPWREAGRQALRVLLKMRDTGKARHGHGLLDPMLIPGDTCPSDSAASGAPHLESHTES